MTATFHWQFEVRNTASEIESLWDFSDAFASKKNCLVLKTSKTIVVTLNKLVQKLVILNHIPEHSLRILFANRPMIFSLVDWSLTFC